MYVNGKKVMQFIKTDAVNVDSELSETSENAVQNKVVTAELNKKVDESKLTAIKIWGGSPNENTSYDLLQSLYDFTFIVVTIKWNIGGIAFNDIMTIPSSMCATFSTNSNRIVLSTDTLYFSLYFPNSNTWYCFDFFKEVSTTIYFEIYGIL